MAYPFEHILIRFNGHFGTSSTISDRWSSGLRFGLASSAPAYDAAKLQTFVNACQASANSFMAAAGNQVGTNCFLDYVTGAQIGALGRYSPTTQLTVTSPTTATPGGGTPVLPWNTALVVSLRTAIPRGRGSNGRLYWPGLAFGVSATTGRVVSSSRATAAAAFLNSLNTAANAYSAGMRVIVASNVAGGIHAPVTSVRVDDRLDTIEARENDQPPNWSIAALS